MASLLRSPSALFTVPFYFTKSDFKTIVAPVTVLAAGSAPVKDISHLLHTVFWLWFHLLQFTVSNQLLDADEDKLNKRDRPLPSGRISRDNAVILRYALVPACVALSAVYSREVVLSSIALVVFTVLYNELRASAGHWVIRNLVNGAGLAAFAWGACLIAGNDRHRLGNAALIAVCATTAVFATTIHAVDFKDEAGDRLVGRKTLPITAPRLARPTLMLLLFAWSLALTLLWDAHKAVTAIFNMLGAVVGVRFVTMKSVHDDQVTAFLYSLWLSAANALPLLSRAVFTVVV